MYKNHKTNPETLPGTPKETYKGSMGMTTENKAKDWNSASQLGEQAHE